MGKHVTRLPAIAILGLFATCSIAPALARGGGGGSGGGRGSAAFAGHGPRAFVRSHAMIRRFAGRNIAFQNNLRLHRGAQWQSGWPIASWLYSWPIDTTPVGIPLVGSERQAGPYVIVIADSLNRAPERTAPSLLPDYSYVPGCHAIPNGYHCDTGPNAPPAR